MRCYRYYNVSQRPHHIIPLKYRTSKAKSLQIKESVLVYCFLVRLSKYIVNFSKIPSNWSRLTRALEWDDIGTF